MAEINERFAKIKKSGKKALIAYFTAGYPSLDSTMELASIALPYVDFIELGIPFSDPLADGPVIQRSSYLALSSGFTLDKFFSGKWVLPQYSPLTKGARGLSIEDRPQSLAMTYYNPVLASGEKLFIKKLYKSGIRGCIVPDLCPEEAGNYIKACWNEGIDTVFLVSPATSDKRLKLISDSSSGFIYAVSFSGTTGIRKRYSFEVEKKLEALRKITDKPVACGFGISDPATAGLVLKYSDGIIIGSALMKILLDHPFRTAKRKIKTFLEKFQNIRG